MRKLVAVVALLSLSACESITGLDGARRLSGDPFRADFMATAECVGVSEDSASSLFADTRWFHAPSLPGDTAGIWVDPYDIYLREGVYAAPDVRNHEVIHLLLQYTDHSHPAFGASDTFDACETSVPTDD